MYIHTSTVWGGNSLSEKFEFHPAEILFWVLMHCIDTHTIKTFPQVLGQLTLTHGAHLTDSQTYEFRTASSRTRYASSA